MLPTWRHNDIQSETNSIQLHGGHLECIRTSRLNRVESSLRSTERQRLRTWPMVSWWAASCAPPTRPWVRRAWTLAYGYHEDRIPTHGSETTREAAMVAFAKSWRPRATPPVALALHTFSPWAICPNVPARHHEGQAAARFADDAGHMHELGVRGSRSDIRALAPSRPFLLHTLDRDDEDVLGVAIAGALFLASNVTGSVGSANAPCPANEAAKALRTAPVMSVVGSKCII
jgi:hypothetical protein